MSNRSHVYRRVRPLLTIDSVGGRSLGNCYSAAFYRVTSERRLSAENLEAMFALGLLGIGQEFYVRSQADGKEEPAIVDEVPCVTVDETGAPTGEPPINPYNGQPITGTAKYNYYVYETQANCDSGD